MMDAVIPAAEQDNAPDAGKFTKKPVTVDAFCWTGQPRKEWPIWAQMSESIQERTKHELITSGEVPKSAEEWINFPDVMLQIATNTGWGIVDHGDWVVMMNPADIYPVKPDAFKAIYEPALDASAPTYGQLAFENNLIMQMMVELYQFINANSMASLPAKNIRAHFNKEFAIVHARIGMLQGIREARVEGGS